MKCPKCKEGEIREQISIKGFIFKKKKVYLYCPLCDFENVREFRLSKEDLKLEIQDRLFNKEIELQKAKNMRETKYDQSYKRKEDDRN